MDIEKATLIRLAVQQLESEVASFHKGIEQEKKAMQEAPSARDSHSDTTRSQKEGLVGALQKQYNEAHKALTALKQIGSKTSEKIGISALVEIEEDKKQMFYLIVPGASMRLMLDDKVIQLISAVSPTARALSGHRAGDTIEVKVPAGIRTLKILGVQ